MRMSSLSIPRPVSRRTARPSHAALSPIPLFFALLGVAGMAALWLLTAMFLQRLSAWMALLAAADIALLLRIAGTLPGRGRALLCVSATAATVIAANWGIVGARTGRAFGYGPLDSILSLGTDLAWTLMQLGTHGPELALYGCALALAWWLGR